MRLGALREQSCVFKHLIAAQFKKKESKVDVKENKEKRLQNILSQSDSGTEPFSEVNTFRVSQLCKPRGSLFPEQQAFLGAVQPTSGR